MNAPAWPAKEAHAKLSPSAAERWMTCPASVPLTRDLPRTATKWSAEGTAAHTLATRALTYRKPCSFWKGEQIEADGYVFVVDDTMAGYVQQYVDHVHSLEGYGDTLMIEQQVEFSEAVGVPGQFGTSDCILLKSCLTHLYVGDLKYGMGVRVNAPGNKQLLTYAVGVLETLAVVLDFDQVEKVTVFIHQPRLDHYDEHEYTIAEVREHAAALKAAGEQCVRAEEAMDVEGDVGLMDFYNPTDYACRWCPIKATCPALQRKVAEAVYNDFEALDDPAALAVLPEPKVPAGDRLGQMFGVLESVETWCRAVRAEIERMVLGGMTVTGPDGLPLKLTEGRRGHRAWADKAAAEGLLVGLLPPEKAYEPRTIITPAAAEKLLDGKKKAKQEWWKETFGPVIKQPPGKPKVTLGSDPAPAYQPAAAAEEFANLDEAPE